MRADAQRNRERLLDVAAELILQVGGEPTHDGLATAAGVGIGTLYRHFPDRQTLLHAVARHVLEATIAAGEAIVSSDVDSLEAVRQYLHAAIDLGIGVVNIIHPLLEDTDWPDLPRGPDRCWTNSSSAADEINGYAAICRSATSSTPQSASAGRSQSGCLSQKTGPSPTANSIATSTACRADDRTTH